MHTDIVSLKDTETDEKIDLNDLSSIDLSKYIMDFANDESVRKKALKKLDKENRYEIITRLLGLYRMSFNNTIKNFLISVVKLKWVEYYCKFQICISFINNMEIVYEDEDEETGKLIENRNKDRKLLGYALLSEHIKESRSLSVPLRLDAVIVLMKSTNHKSICKKYFIEIVTNPTIDSDYKYKAIISLENKDIENRLYYITQACAELIKSDCEISYQILAAQKLLRIEEKIKFAEKFLLSVAQDAEMDANTRADAADTLIGLAKTKKVKEEARRMIDILGAIEGNVKTIFDNAQNVHVTDIEDSVQKALTAILTFPVKKNTDLSFETISGCILDMIDTDSSNEEEEEKEDEKESEKNNDKIRKALNRINLDRAIHSRLQVSLATILGRVWNYMIDHENEEEMKSRLLEELIEMSGTCSTGFASRLVNVVTGFGDIDITITFETQIVANVKGRLNARAKNISNIYADKYEKKSQAVLKLYSDEQKQKERLSVIGSEEYISNAKSRSAVSVNDVILSNNEENENNTLDYNIVLEQFEDDVLYEMTLPSSDRNRTHFLLFFRHHIGEIKEEMYQEFNEYITDSDFDLYMRKAIMIYEGFF